jgi:hypothetical protein
MAILSTRRPGQCISVQYNTVQYRAVVRCTAKRRADVQPAGEAGQVGQPVGGGAGDGSAGQGLDGAGGDAGLRGVSGEVGPLGAAGSPGGGVGPGEVHVPQGGQ